MQNLYERLLEVLGKGHDDPAFRQLMQDLGETPEVLRESKSGCDYLLRDSGLQITFDEKRKCFAAAFLHFGSAMAESGAVQRYGGNLPAGIQFGDSRQEVQRKLDLEPISSTLSPGRTKADPNDLWESYNFLPFQLIFMFRPPSNNLNSLSMRYVPARVSTGREPRELETYFYTACTDATLTVLIQAKAESQNVRSEFVGSEQLLLALLAETQGKVALALRSTGLKSDSVRQKVNEMTEPSPTDGEVRFTPRAKCILEKAVEQSTLSGSSKVEPEHLLMALIDEGEGIAARVFQVFVIDLAALRQVILST